MTNRKDGILAQAFEQTFYQRGIHIQEMIKSLLFGFLGWQTKYKLVEKDFEAAEVIKEKDRNLYNWIEQFLFGLPRLLKNTAKLVTEFLWHALSKMFFLAADYFESLAEGYAPPENTALKRNRNFAPYLGFSFLKYFSQFLGYALWLTAKLGQSLTSPFAATKQTFSYLEKSRGKLTAYIGAGLHGLFSLTLYAALAVFTFPALALHLAGISAGSQLASPTVIAAATFTITPLLAGLKVLLRRISPGKSSAVLPSSSPNQSQHLDGAGMMKDLEKQPLPPPPSIHSALKVETGRTNPLPPPLVSRLSASKLETDSEEDTTENIKWTNKTLRKGITITPLEIVPTPRNIGGVFDVFPPPPIDPNPDVPYAPPPPTDSNPCSPR